MWSWPKWKKSLWSPKGLPLDEKGGELRRTGKAGLILVLGGLGVLILQTTLLSQLPLIPDLTLIFCVYLGLHHRSVGGACGAFFLGYSLDACSGVPVGVHAFALSLVYSTVAAVSRYLWLHSPLTVAAMICLGMGFKTGAFFLLSHLGELSEGVRAMVVHYLVWDVIAALLLTPAIFGLLYRGEHKGP